VYRERVPARPASSLSFMIRALGSRNYRLFFFGQVISLVGTWITTTATNWLIYRLTGSALMLGTVAFAGQFAAFLFGPVAGIFVDRWDRQGNAGGHADCDPRSKRSSNSADGHGRTENGT
jgi:MFS family permease